jgi:hypothetical protein
VVFSGYFLWVLTTNETDRHEITEILLKVALSTKNTIPPPFENQEGLLKSKF